MPKFHILATKLVELRGIVQAKNLAAAKKNVQEHWHVYDTDPNTVTVATSQLGAATPIIAEGPHKIKIQYIEDENQERFKWGNELTKIEKEIKKRKEIMDGYEHTRRRD